MTTFRVTINCDSSDLHGGHPHALARTLVELGHAIAAGHMPDSVSDINGNTVGRVEFGDFEPVDMDRLRELVSEFEGDLSFGAGIGGGENVLVDTAPLRALYELVFGGGSEESDEEPAGEPVRIVRDDDCPSCGYPETYADMDDDAESPGYGALAFGCSRCGWRQEVATDPDDD